MAADYYLEKQNYHETLTCYYNASEFKKMDRFLRQEGVRLLAQNLNISILSWSKKRRIQNGQYTML